jgi:hypothetical protein
MVRNEVMIFPEDYKTIGVKDVERWNNPIYFSTEYMLFLDGLRLYSVSSKGTGFMRTVEKMELLASGTEIVAYPHTVDTRNRAALIEIADNICKDANDATTVIFKGPDEHITFVHEPDPEAILTIEILDVSPPEPPWLVHAIENLERCGVLGDLTVKFRPRILDLRRFNCDCVYYPCRASGLGRSLDYDEVVHDHPRIVGCEVSREIFLATGQGKDYDFVNICPLSSMEPEGPFITRCCRSERRGPVRKNGFSGMVVHWGDSPWSIAEAIRRLANMLREKR